jgi:phosphomannomutase
MNEAHRFDPTILREYDIRGIVGATLTEADARALGRAFARALRGSEPPKGPPPRICVGRDGRLSSPALAARLIEGLVASGCSVVDIGIGPTPLLYFAAHQLKTDGALMVTGSHNGPEFNGFKMMRGLRPFFGDDIIDLGKIAAAGDFDAGAGRCDAHDFRAAYVERIKGEVPAHSRLKVAWDPGNGAAGEVVVQLTATLPGQHVVLNAAIDGRFPAHHPDPSLPENLVELIDTIKTRQLDLGFAFDGDGDRLGVVDRRGRIIWGDQLVALFAREILAERPGATIIGDVKASQILFDEVKRLGGRPLMWRTGHSHIKAKMAETGAPLAGEVSGHIFFADRYFGYDDALYAALRVLGLTARCGRDLADLLDSLPQRRNTPEIRIACPDEHKFAALEALRARLEATGACFSAVDGVRVQTADGWWLLRASNTQPALVARCEAADEQGLSRLKATLREALEASGVAVPGF